MAAAPSKSLLDMSAAEEEAAAREAQAAFLEAQAARSGAASAGPPVPSFEMLHREARGTPSGAMRGAWTWMRTLDVERERSARAGKEERARACGRGRTRGPRAVPKKDAASAAARDGRHVHAAYACTSSAGCADIGTYALGLRRAAPLFGPPSPPRDVRFGVLVRTPSQKKKNRARRTDTLATHSVFHDGKFELSKQVASALQVTHRFMLGAQPLYALSGVLLGSRVRPAACCQHGTRQDDAADFTGC